MSSNNTIQWFPGHMAKARREISEKLKYVDVIFELVDARLPISSRNPMLDEIIQQKPRLLILNKSDMADPIQNKEWQDFFKNNNQFTILVDSKNNKGINRIFSVSQEILKEKIERQRKKGLRPQPIRAMVVGIPNVGKSTLMNRLVKKNIANTGNKPGVTKSQQWLKVDNKLELLDTPGILWPKFDDDSIGKKLALSGAIKENLFSAEDIALFGISFFQKYYPDELSLKYNIDVADIKKISNIKLIDIINTKYGNNTNDIDEMIVREIREGKIGRYSLDRVEDYSG